MIHYYLRSWQDTNPDAITAYYHLYEYLKHRLSDNRYIIHKKYHFEINLISSVVLTIAMHNQDVLPLTAIYQAICDTIAIKKDYNYSHLLPNLLFIKCLLCHKLNYDKEYETTLTQAKNISQFYLGEDRTLQMIQWLEEKKDEAQ